MSKVIAITGGAQGIGKAIANSFLSEGWNVAIIDFDREALEEIKEENRSYSKNFIAFQGDVSVEKDLENWLGEIIKKFNGVYALINNAGIFLRKPITELTYSEWKKVIDINLSSIFLTAKYFYPHLRKQKGSIVNISSTRAFQSEKDTEAYSASKGGIISLTHSLAISLGPDVRVNSISPGWIETESLKKNSLKKEVVLRPEDHNQHPAGRVGMPQDIVNGVRFLIDEKNTFITATNIIIDGGMTKKNDLCRIKVIFVSGGIENEGRKNYF